MKLPTFKYWLRLNKYPPPLFWDGREAQSHTPERLLGAGYFKEPGTTGEKIISKNIWSMKNLYGYLQHPSPKEYFLTKISSSHFYGYEANIRRDIRLSNPRWLLHLCRNTLWREWEAIAFLVLFIYHFNFHSTMPKSNENATGAKRSTSKRTSTGTKSVSNAAVRPRVITHHFREATKMIPPAAAGKTFSQNSCGLKKSSIFAASSTKRRLSIVNSGSYFYGYLKAIICKDKGLSIHCWLPRLRCNFSWSRCGAIAYLIFNYLIFSSTMTKRNENASSVKNNSAQAREAYESGNLTISKLTETLLQLKEINNYFINELWESLKEEHGSEVFKDVYFDNLDKIESGIIDIVSGIGGLASTAITNVYYNK